MIFTQSFRSRRFVGRLDPGADLVATLAGLCKDSGVKCGEIRGVGVLEEARLVHFSTEKRRFLSAKSVKEPHQLDSLQGNISMQDAAVHLHLYATLSREFKGAVKSTSGLIEEAKVVSFEFVIDAFDDMVYHRAEDPRTGSHEWLIVSPAEETEDLGQPRQPGAPIPTAREYEEEKVFEVKPGDILDHPRLGRCLVLQFDGEERCTIRLPTQRVVDLHLGLLKLRPLSTLGKSTVYTVEIRRKA